jgi:hypothetical protein
VQVDTMRVSATACALGARRGPHLSTRRHWAAGEPKRRPPPFRVRRA